MNKIEQNKKLIERYPFLLPRNRFTDKVQEDYDYSWTELDCLDEGWRKAFGEMILEEIRDDLIKEGLLNTYRIDQIKEKYGELRWYTRGGSKNEPDIVNKYTILSRNICGHCGQPDSGITKGGWIYPICKDCWDKNQQRLKNEGIISEMRDYDECCDRGTMANEMKYTKWSNGETEEVVIDISETANKIRERWRNRNDNKSE